MITFLHRLKYVARGVLRVIHMRFLPSLCADGGPVAETETGTVGNGRAGVSLLMRGRCGSAFGIDFWGAGGGGVTLTARERPNVSWSRIRLFESCSESSRRFMVKA
jgi:hypothetical protein